MPNTDLDSKQGNQSAYVIKVVTLFEDGFWPNRWTKLKSTSITNEPTCELTHYRCSKIFNTCFF